MFLSKRKDQSDQSLDKIRKSLEKLVSFWPTHEGVAGGKTLVISSIVVDFSLLLQLTVTLLVRAAMKEACFGELHQDGRGAEIEMFRQKVVPLFRAAVGVNADRSLVDGWTWRLSSRGKEGSKRNERKDEMYFIGKIMIRRAFSICQEIYTNPWSLLMDQWSTCPCEGVSWWDLDNGRAEGRWLPPSLLHFLYPAGKDLCRQSIL